MDKNQDFYNLDINNDHIDFDNDIRFFKNVKISNYKKFGFY